MCPLWQSPCSLGQYCRVNIHEGRAAAPPTESVRGRGFKMADSLSNRLFSLAGALVLGLSLAVHADGLQEAVEGAHRTPEFVERDRYRNPAQTLRFFDVRPEHDVVEIGPGAGWYTEILAPYVEGNFYAAHFPENSGVEYFDRIRNAYEERLARDPEVFGNVQIVVFDPATGALELLANSVGCASSSLSVHTWFRFDFEDEAFASFFRVLRPGGLLGIVQHRSRQMIDREQMVDTVYAVQDAVIEAAHA